MGILWVVCVLIYNKLQINSQQDWYALIIPDIWEVEAGSQVPDQPGLYAGRVKHKINVSSFYRP